MEETTRETRLREGERMRRTVLGDAHVDRSQANATPFTQDLQELVTEYCWGTIWTREGIEPRERSLVNLGMIAALGKMAEFELHVRGAIRNGLTPDEVKEVILQIGIYCGVPAAIEASRHAGKVLDEMRANGELAAE
jgi:4-carboxymuconolactone decarboxylase